MCVAPKPRKASAKAMSPEQLWGAHLHGDGKVEKCLQFSEHR